jgi:hypothetical protein
MTAGLSTLSIKERNKEDLLDLRVTVTIIGFRIIPN